MMLEDFHRFKGVKRSTHPINLDTEYLWDAHNIRFENKDDGTFLSIVNEVEPQPVLSVSFPSGTYVGHCILGKFLIVFIHSTKDYICKVYKSNGNFLSKLLFNGDLNLDPNHPIQALGVYENDVIQKVYWTDGINLPRYINIADDTIRTKASSVDFVAELTLGDSIKVTDNESGGLFAPGVILYAITYYNKYGAETSIIYTSPLHYIHPNNRGAKADELVLCSFNITITKGSTTDLNDFDYIRIYSIHRTSLDAEPTVKQIADIQITDKDSYTITDSGYIGETVDPSALLYIGGEELLANCIEAKDNTLFLGDITHKRMEAFKPYKNASTLATLRDSITWSSIYVNKKANDNGENHLYGLPGSMFDSPCFKYGEWYRCGILLQYKNGKWSEPIFLKDTSLNNITPFTLSSIIQGSLLLTIPAEQAAAFYNAGFRRIRTCVVFPSISERKIITLGIVAPTVFNIQGRNSEAPYALASWFFRPKNKFIAPENTFHNQTGSYIQFLHNKSLFTDKNSTRNSGAEIQGATTYEYSDTIPGNAYQSTFFVDENIVTMHSPDIEWDETLANLGYEDTLFNAIGIACLDAVFGTSEIQMSTATVNPKASGLVTPKRNYTTNSNLTMNGGLIAANCFTDSVIKNDKEHTFDENVVMQFPVYPWHRSGSLNNDNTDTTARVRSAVLSKKCIGNLKYFRYNICNTINGTIEPVTYNNIGEPVYINSTEVTIDRIRVPHLMRECSYEGSIDTVITHLSSSYPLVVSPSDGYISESNDPIRMKYKSSPHLVFSLGHKYYGPSYPSILPIASDIDGTEADLDGTLFVLPTWDLTTDTGNTGGDNVVVGANDHIAYIICELTPNPPSPPIPDNGLIYCPPSGGSASIPYLRFWRGVNNAYVQEDLTGKVLTLGYSGLNADGNRMDVTKVIRNFSVSTSPSIILTKCDSSGNKTGTINIGLYLLSSLTENYWEWRNDAPLLAFKIHGTGANQMFEPVTLASTMAETPEPLADEAKLFTIDLPVLSGVTAGNHSYMIIGELQRGLTPTFGGNSEEALLQNLWLPSSDSVLISPSSSVKVSYRYGDTWVSRYDCLKTYPFTLEDENQIVEIGSFLLESRINMDGRCDRNRGSLSLTNMSPLNFNLFNPVYNQLNNFFKYRIYDKDYYDLIHWQNQITWSQLKFAASHIDPWTLITLSNVQDLDGDKGAITAIVNYNDVLFYFQEHAFGLVLFNSRVLVEASDGVPIEISNGYKVDGVRVISNNVGCLDKWAITLSPNALYFVDQSTKTLWNYSGNSLQDFSTTLGLSYWFKKNCSPSKLKWNINNGIRLGYDLVNQDVYFATGQLDYSNTLCYSEKLGAGTGTYNYVGVPPFTWEGDVLSLETNTLVSDTPSLNVKVLNLYRHNVSDIAASNPSITFISNANPNITKIFDTLEFRGDIILEGTAKNMIFPFTRVDIENEYLKGSTIFDSHTLRKKFRVWRALFPRVSDTALGPRNKFARARVRNPWVKIKLTNEDTSLGLSTLVLHDMSVKYTI